MQVKQRRTMRLQAPISNGYYYPWQCAICKQIVPCKSCDHLERFDSICPGKNIPIIIVYLIFIYSFRTAISLIPRKIHHLDISFSPSRTLLSLSDKTYNLFIIIKFAPRFFIILIVSIKSSF